VRSLLNASISILLLGAALYLLDWESLYLAIQKVDLWAFGIAVLLILVIFSVLGVRWYRIIQPVAPLSFTEHLRYFFYGLFLNSFTPANLGGDVYRIVSLKPSASSSLSIALALIKERLCGLLAYLMAYLVCLSIFWSSEGASLPHSANIFLYTGGVIVLATAGLFFGPSHVLSFAMTFSWVQSRKPLHATLGCMQAASRFKSFQEFVSLMGYSAVGILLWLLAVRIVALDLGLDISWSALGAVVILVELIRLVPITLQGVGIREGAFAYLFKLLGESPETGFALGLVSYLALSLAIVLSGLLGWGVPRFIQWSTVK